MTTGDANARRLCLCCGRPGARLLRLRDGRAIRSCDVCLRNCDGCRAWVSGATDRKPIGRESDYWFYAHETAEGEPCRQ